MTAKRISSVVIAVMACICAHATIQCGEVLVAGCDRYGLYSYPLERLDSVRLGEFRRTLDSVNAGYCRTDCYRGYIGTWKIDGGRLYLVKLSSLGGTDLCNLDLFDEFRDETGRIFASWVDRPIFVCNPDSRPIAGYGLSEVYEHETVFFMRHGRVKRTKSYHNTYDESRCSLEKRDSLSECVAKVFPAFADGRLLSAMFSVTPNKKGRARKVENIKFTKNEIRNRRLVDITQDSTSYRKYFRRTRRIIRKSDCWDVLIRHGRIDSDLGILYSPYHYRPAAKKSAESRDSGLHNRK